MNPRVPVIVFVLILLVVLVVELVSLNQPRALPSIAGPSGPEPTAVEPPPSPNPSLAGLHVYTVSELLAARAAGRIHGEQVALRGYWTVFPYFHSCAPTGPDADVPPGDLELNCTDGDWGITELDEPMMTLDAETGDVTLPAGPHLSPYVDDPDIAAVLFPVRRVYRDGERWVTPAPVPIVVVGHFDDPRAADCRPRNAALCRDRLVIDRLVSFR